jgi:thiamine kinase-like enzyme
MLASHPGYAQLGERADTGSRTTVQAEIKGQRLPDRRWELDRFYWSFQHRDDPAIRPFQALTLVYSARTGEAVWHEFPDEPYLTKLPALFGGQSPQERGTAASRVEVLQYVPLRRLTFRASTGDQAAQSVIGKFKRRSRLREAYDRLSMVARAVGRSPSSFSVALPLGLDEARGLFFQETQPGQAVSTLLDVDTLTDLLYGVGALHHDLHQLPAGELPRWNIDALVERLEADVAWITLFRPEQGEFLDGLSSLLRTHVPQVDPADYAFCHGDFVCSHILKADDQWSVVDFDLAMAADPYLDVAMLLASLPYDVPLLTSDGRSPRGADGGLLGRACDAYLRGYRERAEREFDETRLLWYRICAELYYLALMFRKDRFYPVAFDRATALVRELGEKLQQLGAVRA